MRIPPARLVPVLLLLAAPALAGCSGAGGTWHGRDLEQTNPRWLNTTLEPGWSFRLDVVANSQTEVAWDWFVQERQPVPFSFHRHDPDGMVELRALSATDDKGSIVSEFSAIYSYIWTNSLAEPLDLWFRVGTPVGGGLYPPGEDPKADVCFAASMRAC